LTHHQRHSYCRRSALGSRVLDHKDAAANPLRALPQLHRLLETPQAQALAQGLAQTPVQAPAQTPAQALTQASAQTPAQTPSQSQAADTARARLAQALRSVLAAERAALLADPARPPPEAGALLDRAEALLRDSPDRRLRRVINATGIILHTNLGRAPLAPGALAAAAQASGYATLEYDLQTGRRGSRTQSVEPLLQALTGAEAALAVNNAAAAVLLALSALASGHEVVVSRGELVEIGGGFRIPDVIRQGGATLVEVGTTNKTRLADYADAIGPRTRMLLKVHQSNYRVVGFTGEAGLAELSALARARGLILMQDLGSGAMIDLRRLGRPPEPTAADALAAGVDLVAFSGDKLLGGPQAGLLAGRAEVLAPLRRHPLMRALRLDKLCLAALEATLRLYLDPPEAMKSIPVLRMLGQDETGLAARAARLQALLGNLEGDREGDTRIVTTEAYAGGGTLPGSAIASRALQVRAADPERLAALLRRGEPPVVARLSGGHLLLDMLALDDEELPSLAAALRRALDA